MYQLIQSDYPFAICTVLRFERLTSAINPQSTLDILNEADQAEVCTTLGAYNNIISNIPVWVLRAVLLYGWMYYWISQQSSTTGSTQFNGFIVLIRWERLSMINEVALNHIIYRLSPPRSNLRLILMKFNIFSYSLLVQF